MTEAQKKRAKYLTAVAAQFISVSDASEILGVTRQRVVNRIHEESLPAAMVGTQFLIPRFVVEREAKMA